MNNTLSRRRRFWGLAGLSALFLVLQSSTASALTADQEFWISRTATLSQTRIFTGTAGEKRVSLRLAPLPGKPSEFRGAYTTFSQTTSVVNERFLDGVLRADNLELHETAFDWDKEKVVSHPAFTLSGTGNAFPAKLAGTWSDGGKSHTVNLTERAFRFPSGASITVTRIEKDFPKLNYSVAMRYPQLSRPGSTLSSGAQAFNREVAGAALASINTFKQQMKGFDAPSPGSTEKIERPAAYDAGAFGITWAANDLVSGDLYQDLFLGGAHGIAVHAPITFDFKRGRKLALGDLFAPGSHYLQTISSLCRPALTQFFGKNTQPQDITTGSAPKTENYKIWTLTPVGLLITFGDYQIGPYSQGESSVLIPYSALKHILKPEYAVRLS